MQLLCSLTIACLRVCVTVCVRACVRARMFILEGACFEEEGEVSLRILNFSQLFFSSCSGFVIIYLLLLISLVFVCLFSSLSILYLLIIVVIISRRLI